VDDHFGYVLGIRYVERREDSDLGEWIETSAAAFLDR
jgi:hypothetical protein